TDLRAHQAHAAAVEAAAEVEGYRLLAVPRADDHGALRRDAVDRLLKRGWTAARVDGDVRAAPSGERAQQRAVSGRDRGLRAAAFGEGAPQRRRLDRDDARPRAT